MSRINTAYNVSFLQLNEAKTSYENAQQAVAEKQQELNACSKEIKSLVANREKCLKAVQVIDASQVTSVLLF